ncbi:MAG: T9SS type A sorting domain-containing protein [Candidatus Kapaibacterium sp.]
MKAIYFFLIIALVIASTVLQTVAQEYTSTEGTEFFVAFPLNDSEDQQLQTLAIYVTSRVDNKVTIFNPRLNINDTRIIKANETVEFSTVKGGFDISVEQKVTDTVINNGIKITSDFPVSVYCLNSKFASSEGYMALPIKSWGKEYIHNSFYDFAEIIGRDWGGGFVVLAKEDNTELHINIRDGANGVSGFGETTGGQQHGDIVTKTLNAGDIYVVQGSGKTRGIFDLSGSVIIADKPIGLISYHNRAMIPSTIVQTGRDHLIEMLPPTQAWGKEYFSVELDRGADKGDYFRVIAGEDNVTFNITWYDKQTNQKIDEVGPINLKKKGHWFAYNGEGATMPHDLESIRGVAHFKADKPILVCQYSYSSNYDGATSFDPFMIVLSSVEQYTTSALATTPLNYGNNEYRENFLRIIAKGDSNDVINNQMLLNSIKLNNTPLKDISTFNRIPNSDYYWIALSSVKAGSLNLESETPFSANIYGFANFDSYGWPASPNGKNLQDSGSISSVPFTSESGTLDIKLLSSNPAKSDRLKLNISNDEASAVKIYVTNLEGKVVLDMMNEIVGNNQDLEFDISELKSGIYFINANNGSSQSIIKLAVER